MIKSVHQHTTYTYSTLEGDEQDSPYQMFTVGLKFGYSELIAGNFGIRGYINASVSKVLDWRDGKTKITYTYTYKDGTTKTFEEEAEFSELEIGGEWWSSSGSVNADFFYAIPISSTMYVAPFIGIGLGFLVVEPLPRDSHGSSWENTHKFNAFHLPINVGVDLIFGRHLVGISSRIPVLPFTQKEFDSYGSGVYNFDKKTFIFNVLLSYSLAL